MVYIKKDIMKKHRCKVCGYVYDPENGDMLSGTEPGTGFENLPNEWRCPICGVTKDDFDEI
jgi:rubredoxin